MNQKDLPVNTDVLSYVISLKLRTFLTITILLVIFSAIAFTLYRGIEERNRADKSVEKEIEQALKVTNEKVDKLFDDVNRTLILLGSIPEVKSGSEEECNNYLRMFLRDHIQYVNFGVADTNGNVICSAVPLEKPVNLSDRTYFLDAKEDLSFAPGSYRINRITKTATVSFGYPILDGSSGTDRVVFTSIGIDGFKNLISDNASQVDMAITIFDKNGTILAREPEFEQWVGTPVANKPLVKVVMAKAEGGAELEGLDGVIRYYKFLPLLYGTGDGGYLTVGASKKEAVERVDKIYVRTISFLVLASMGVLASNLIIEVLHKNNVNPS